MTRQNEKNDNQMLRQGLHALLGVESQVRTHAAFIYITAWQGSHCVILGKSQTSLSPYLGLVQLFVAYLYSNLEAMIQPHLMPADTETGAHMD